MAGMLSSIGPTGVGTGLAPNAMAHLWARAASTTRKRRWPMDLGKLGGKTVGLGIKDVIHVALSVEGHSLGTMTRNRSETHGLKQGAKLVRLRVGKLDELEAVGSHRIVIRNRRRRSIIREGTHSNGLFYRYSVLSINIGWGSNS